MMEPDEINAWLRGWFDGAAIKTSGTILRCPFNTDASLIANWQSGVCRGVTSRLAYRHKT